MDERDTNPRFGCSVVLRSGASFTIHCEDVTQAEDCIHKWNNALLANSKFCNFESASGKLNFTLTSEIVSMCVLDYDFMDKVAVNLCRDNRRISEQVNQEFPDPED